MKSFVSAVTMFVTSQAVDLRDAEWDAAAFTDYFHHSTIEEARGAFNSMLEDYKFESD